MWRRPGDQFGEPSQVLSDSRQNKLILGASRAAQSKPVEPQDTLEVCKPHLDFLALTPRLFEALGANERPGNVAGARSWISRGILRDGSFGQHCGLSGHIPQSRLLARGFDPDQSRP
jgi:hypothetical protein